MHLAAIVRPPGLPKTSFGEAVGRLLIYMYRYEETFAFAEMITEKREAIVTLRIRVMSKPGIVD